MCHLFSCFGGTSTHTNACKNRGSRSGASTGALVQNRPDTIAYASLPNMLIYENISCSIQVCQQAFMQIGLLPQEINILEPTKYT